MREASLISVHVTEMANSNSDTASVIRLFILNAVNSMHNGTTIAIHHRFLLRCHRTEMLEVQQTKAENV